MASRQTTVDYIVEQASGAGGVTARKMFGEYALYCGDRLVGLICNDRLFVKPTAEGRAFFGPAEEAPPYPSAKPCLVIPPDTWDDSERLSTLVKLTAAHVPAPKPKRPRTSR